MGVTIRNMHEDTHEHGWLNISCKTEKLTSTRVRTQESYNLEHPTQLVDSPMGLSISSLLVGWPESSQSVVYSR